jgi:hypothetical protein
MNLDYEKLEAIGTKVIENEKFHELLLTISNKDFLDYTLPFAPIALAALTIILGYRSFNTRLKELKGEQIILKDIDKLYESANAFFTYVDAARLFFSLVDKRAKRTIKGKAHNDEFESNYKHAENDFFPKISKIKEAIFILKTLKNNELALNLEMLNKFIIENRRNQKLILDNDNNLEELKEISNNYKNLRKEIDTKVEACTLGFIEAKKAMSE